MSLLRLKHLQCQKLGYNYTRRLQKGEMCVGGGSKRAAVKRAKSSSFTVGIHWIMFKSEKSRQSRIRFLLRTMEAKSKASARKLEAGKTPTLGFGNRGKEGWDKRQLVFCFKS